MCAMALALAGCNQEKPASNEPAAVKPTVQPLMLSCDDASIKNRLVREVQAVLEKRTLSLIQTYDDAEAVGLERRVQQRLTELVLDLQNVQAATDKEDDCQTDLQVLFTADDIKHANAQANKNTQPNIQTVLAEHDAILANNSVTNNSVTVPLQYHISGMEVSIKHEPKVLDVLAQMLVSSVYGAAVSDEMVDISGRAAPKIVPVAPIAVVRSEVAEREAVAAQVDEPKEKPSDTEVATVKAVSEPAEGVTRTIKPSQKNPPSPAAEPAQPAQPIQSIKDTKPVDEPEQSKPEARSETYSETKTSSEPKSEPKQTELEETY